MNVYDLLDGIDHDSKDWRAIADGYVVEAKRLAGAMLKAEQGTHGHLLSEDDDLGRSIIDRLKRGEDVGLPVAVQHAVVDVWRSLVEAYFDVLEVEASCVYDRWRVAGTLDRIARTKIDLTFGDVTIPAGTVLVCDIKTGSLKIGRDGRPDYWSAYAVQVAAYANSVPYDVDTERRGTWEHPPSTEHALIAHINIGGALDTDVMCAQLFYVDLAAGHEAGELVCACKEWQKRRDVFSPEGLYCSTLTINTEATCTPSATDAMAATTSTSSTGAPCAETSRCAPNAEQHIDKNSNSSTRADVVATLGYDHDEGATVDPAMFDPLQALHATLPKDAQDWFHRLVGEARRASVPFGAIDTKTERRYQLYRGLLTLAASEANHE